MLTNCKQYQVFVIKCISILLWAQLAGCSKNHNDKSDSSDQKDPVIYIAGEERENPAALFVAKYWKNGTQGSLTDGSKDAYATDIAVSGNDLYITGYEKSVTTGYFVARYWKNNNAPVSLTDHQSHGYAEAIKVDDDNIYIAGYDQDNTVLGNARNWENGVEHKITGAQKQTTAAGIDIKNGDVFMVGTESGTSVAAMGRCWKNGSLLFSLNTESNFNAIVVQ